MKPQRLDKLLASQSTNSRSDVKEWIRKGLVRVNGAVERRAERKVEPDTDVVEVNGARVETNEHVYLMLDKPKGVVSATRGDGPTVVDLVPEHLRRKGLFPAGRLDKDTTGFVLITDDGDFAHRILSPKNHIPKTYLATLDFPVDDEVIAGFERGFALGGGDTCRPARLTVPQPELAQHVQVVLTEGMYHQIKRMFAHFGRTVLELRRVRMGALFLDETLGAGGCRPLTPTEKALLTAPLDE